MIDGSSGGEMHILLKMTIYAIYGIILPLLIIDFIAKRIANHMKSNPTVGKTTKVLIGSVGYLRFLTPSARRITFIRAAIITPAQYFDSLPGDKVINADPRNERREQGSEWDNIRRNVYQRDNHTCQICGNTGGKKGGSELHADHIVPVSRGGSNARDNLRTLCSTCHQARHARRF